MSMDSTPPSKYTIWQTGLKRKIWQLRPIGKGDQELEKRLDQKELT
jgi:hypothetical protein